MVKAYLHTDHAAWVALSQDPARYAEEKERIADQFVAALDARREAVGPPGAAPA